jgi:hypothetical protein
LDFSLKNILKRFFMKIKIHTLDNRSATEFNYNPEEPMWQFCQRFGLAEGRLENNITLHVRFLHQKVLINTYENRLKKVSELVLDPERGLHSLLMLGGDQCAHIMAGNASELGGGDRDVCSICLESFQVICRGPKNNPWISCALRCSHVFHTGCLAEAVAVSARCPVCREELGEGYLKNFLGAFPNRIPHHDLTAYNWAETFEGFLRE